MFQVINVICLFLLLLWIYRCLNSLISTCFRRFTSKFDTQNLICPIKVFKSDYCRPNERPASDCRIKFRWRSLFICRNFRTMNLTHALIYDWVYFIITVEHSLKLRVNVICLCKLVYILLLNHLTLCKLLLFKLNIWWRVNNVRAKAKMLWLTSFESL